MQNRQPLNRKDGVIDMVNMPANSKPFLNTFRTKAMHAARHQPCILDDTCSRTALHVRCLLYQEGTAFDMAMQYICTGQNPCNY